MPDSIQFYNHLSQLTKRDGVLHLKGDNLQVRPAGIFGRAKVILINLLRPGYYQAANQQFMKILDKQFGRLMTVQAPLPHDFDHRPLRAMDVRKILSHVQPKIDALITANKKMEQQQCLALDVQKERGVMASKPFCQAWKTLDDIEKSLPLRPRELIGNLPSELKAFTGPQRLAAFQHLMEQYRDGCRILGGAVEKSEHLYNQRREALESKNQTLTASLSQNLDEEKKKVRDLRQQVMTVSDTMNRVADFLEEADSEPEIKGLAQDYRTVADLVSEPVLESLPTFSLDLRDDRLYAYKSLDKLPQDFTQNYALNFEDLTQAASSAERWSDSRGQQFDVCSLFIRDLNRSNIVLGSGPEPGPIFRYSQTEDIDEDRVIAAERLKSFCGGDGEASFALSRLVTQTLGNAFMLSLSDTKAITPFVDDGAGLSLAVGDNKHLGVHKEGTGRDIMISGNATDGYRIHGAFNFSLSGIINSRGKMMTKDYLDPSSFMTLRASLLVSSQDIKEGRFKVSDTKMEGRIVLRSPELSEPE